MISQHKEAEIQLFSGNSWSSSAGRMGYVLTLLIFVVRQVRTFMRLLIQWLL